MKDIFISYASEELNIAESICTLLENSGVTCFISVRDIRAGREYAEELVNAIDNAKALVLVLTKHSNQSPHVLREIERAVSHNMPILVYVHEEVQLNKSMEYFLMTHQWIMNDENSAKNLLDGVANAMKNTGKTINRKASTKIGSTSKKSKMAWGLAISACAVATIMCGLVLYLVLHIGTKDDASDSNDENMTQETSVVEVNYEVADTIELGSYNGAPIEWRILRINYDGTAIVVAKDILTIKAFDTAEGGEYNMYNGVDYWTYENHIITDPELLILARGNNDWSLSNIRTWLNSSKELVKYEDQAPTYKASCTHNNAYSEEPGFLHDFTDEERNAIVLSTHYTKANSLRKDADFDGNIKTEDYVYLLSEGELSLFEEAGISVYAGVTEQAIEQDDTKGVESHFDIHDSKHYYWWLRDCVDESTSLVKLACTEREDELISERYNAGAASFGIRPAMVVDLQSTAIVKK